MPSKPESYPAIYIIFTLLNTIRRGIERKNIWREHLHRTAFGAVQVFRRQKIVFKPRMSFWVAICKKAGLIKEVSTFRQSSRRGSRSQVSSYELRCFNCAQCRVTSYAQAWLRKSPEEQTLDLIEAWQNAPKNLRVRQFRRKLLWKLKYAQPLTQKDKGTLHGLEALGLIAKGKLTRWGEYFIQGKGSLPSPKANESCKLQEEQFIASIPAHADLLWDIERFLRPKCPGVYSLSKRPMKFYEGDPAELIELLERGLGGPLPNQTKALLLDQPSIRIVEGIVLEFSSPSELKQLRRQPAFRKYVDEFLSPQRVLVSHEKAQGLFRMLMRWGVHVRWNEEQAETRKKRTHFMSQPGAILNPVGTNLPKLALLEHYQRLGQALDVWYRAPGCMPEKRRITPLFIEERGGQTYIIAYCQTRRAQRTFRLDRMEIPGTW